jgi:hypothetical protein
MKENDICLAHICLDHQIIIKYTQKHEWNK